MRRMLIPLALVLTACGTGQTGSTPPAVQALPAGGLFAYSYEPGSTYSYAYRLTQKMDIIFEAEGNPELFAGDEAPPEQVQAQISVSGTITYDVEAGPQPETYEIKLAGTLGEVTVTGTVDGEPITDEFGLSEAGAPDFVQTPNVRIVIDSHGNLLEGEVDGEEIPEFELFEDPFSGFEDVTSGGLNNHFGPAFPEGPLAVGDSWSDTLSNDVFDQTFTVSSTHTVTGIEDFQGAEVAVIGFSRAVSGLTVDLAQLMAALFEGFGGEGPEEDPLEGLNFTFLIALDPSQAAGTVWFDPVAGITRRFAQATSVSMTMEFAMDDGRQAGSMLMDMAFDVSVDAELQA